MGDIQDRGRDQSVKQKLHINLFCHHQNRGDCEENVHIYLNLVLMKTKSYQRRNIKEEKVWNQESIMHKLMDILEVK